MISLEQLNARLSKLIYSNLTHGQIRTVTLHGGNWQDQIRCSLATLELIPLPGHLFNSSADNEDYDYVSGKSHELIGSRSDGVRGYEALSYVWGSEGNPVQMLLEGQEYWITSNLEAALLHLRLPDRDRVMWIDALCINQSDFAERNSQVRRMHKIYEGAYRTIVWLGPRDETSDIAMKFVLDYEASDHNEESVYDDTDIVAHASAIERLYRREYWDRLWVMQELHFSRKPILVCGQFSVAYSAVEELSDCFLTADYQDKLSAALLRHGRSIESGYYQDCLKYEGPHRMPPKTSEWLSTVGPALFLTWFVKNKKCSDPRDTVFGISQLIPDFEGVMIDYSLKTADVLVSATVALLKSSHQLDLITWPKSIERRHGEAVSGPDIPSWVIDLSYRYLAVPFNWLYLPPSTNHHEDRTVRPCSFQISENVLSVLGIRYGKIKHVERQSREYKDGRKTRTPYAWAELHEFWLYLIQCWAVISNQLPDPDLAGFLRTMSAGKDQSADRILDLFEYWLRLSESEKERFSKEIELKILPDALNWLSTERDDLAFRALILFDPLYSSVSQYGVASSFAEVGDIICLLEDCGPPVILRPAPAGHCYIIGDSYVDDLYLRDWESSTFESRRLHNIEPNYSLWERFIIH